MRLQLASHDSDQPFLKTPAMIDNATTALARWKPVGSEYQATYYYHENDKAKLHYACIDRDDIETCLPSAGKDINVVFILKTDILKLENAKDK